MGKKDKKTKSSAKKGKAGKGSAKKAKGAIGKVTPGTESSRDRAHQERGAFETLVADLSDLAQIAAPTFDEYGWFADEESNLELAVKWLDLADAHGWDQPNMLMLGLRSDAAAEDMEAAGLDASGVAAWREDHPDALAITAISQVDQDAPEYLWGLLAPPAVKAAAFAEEVWIGAGSESARPSQDPERVEARRLTMLTRGGLLLQAMRVRDSADTVRIETQGLTATAVLLHEFLQVPIPVSAPRLPVQRFLGQTLAALTTDADDEEMRQLVAERIEDGASAAQAMADAVIAGALWLLGGFLADGEKISDDDHDLLFSDDEDSPQWWEDREDRAQVLDAMQRGFAQFTWTDYLSKPLAAVMTPQVGIFPALADPGAMGDAKLEVLMAAVPQISVEQSLAGVPADERSAVEDVLTALGLR